jgi:hypothetical protein
MSSISSDLVMQISLIIYFHFDDKGYFFATTHKDIEQAAWVIDGGADCKPAEVYVACS